LNSYFQMNNHLLPFWNLNTTFEPIIHIYIVVIYCNYSFVEYTQGSTSMGWRSNLVRRSSNLWFWIKKFKPIEAFRKLTNFQFLPQICKAFQLQHINLFIQVNMQECNVNTELHNMHVLLYCIERNNSPNGIKLYDWTKILVIENSIGLNETSSN
jgi:hypothetical protein